MIAPRLAPLPKVTDHGGFFVDVPSDTTSGRLVGPLISANVNRGPERIRNFLQSVSRSIETPITYSATKPAIYLLIIEGSAFAS